MPAEQNARRLLSTAAAISCSQCPKFIGDSKLSSLSPSLCVSLTRSLFLSLSRARPAYLTARRGSPHLPTYPPTYSCRRSIDLPQSGSRARPWIPIADALVALASRFFALALLHTFRSCWLIHLAPAARSAPTPPPTVSRSRYRRNFLNLFVLFAGFRASLEV